MPVRPRNCETNASCPEDVDVLAAGRGGTIVTPHWAIDRLSSNAADDM